MNPRPRNIALAALVLAGSFTAGAAAADRAGRAVDAMTLYARGAAVVEDTRTVKLVKGKQRITWPAPGGLKAQTFWLSGAGVRLNGLQTTPFVGRHKDPLAARIGRSVTLTGGNGRDHGGSRQGRLVAVHGASAFVRVGGRIERLTASSPWQIGWPATNKKRDKSGLWLDVAARSAGPKKLTATYQLAAPSWQAAYTARFDPDAGRLVLQSTAVIDNSGRQSPLAARKAWLVAGNVARGGDRHPPALAMARAKTAAAGAGAPKAAGAIYRYALKNGLHVPAGATRAIALMAPVSFAAKLHNCFNSFALADRGDRRAHASVYITFKNTHDAPLPAGTVRVYNAARAADLMGAASIDDTPSGAPVEVTLGKSFDVTATHRVSHVVRPQKDRRSVTVKITVYNAGARSAHVALVETLPSRATVTSASHKREKQAYADDTAMWKIQVPARGKTKLRYTVSWPVRS